MSDITDITTLVRYLINDYAHTMKPGDIFTYNTSGVFELTESNVISVSSVWKNSVELGSGDWTYDSDTNKVTVTATLTTGDTVEIRYTYYPNYSATEFENYIKGAIVHLSINNYYTFEVDANGEIYPEPSTAEKNLIAFVTAIMLEPNNVNYRLPDISISNPKSLPTRDLISKAISIFKHNVHGVFTLT